MLAGLYGVGILVLYMLLRSVLHGAAPQSHSGGAGPSNAYQVDLLVVKVLLYAPVLSYTVHCLGGAWVPWLGGWLLWCCCQLLPHLRVVTPLQSGLLLVVVAVVLPVSMCWWSFKPEAILVQARVLELLPVLQRLQLGSLLQQLQ